MPTPEALAWARRAFPGLDPVSARALPPAGSARTLTRLFHTGGSLVLVENPVEVTAAVNENDAFGYLAAHLGARGIPVPGVLAYKRSRGWSLVEDLGDRDLCGEVRRIAGLGSNCADGAKNGAWDESRSESARHDQTESSRLRPGVPASDSGGPDPSNGNDHASREHIAGLYREALAVLVRLQVDGVEGFDPRRTHNPPRYDVALMREWESGYFVRELLGRHLGQQLPPGLDSELDRLAERAAAAGAPYLLHRDYQSQNLKIHLGRICVIDFQGARLGPAQYDLAALVLDPYADLPADLRRELLDHYLGLFSARTGVDHGRFMEHFSLIAAHRLMQALGAYAFLGLQRGKPAFLAHIPAALRLLAETIAPIAGTVPRLAASVAEARQRTAAPGATAAPGGAGRDPAG